MEETRCHKLEDTARKNNSLLVGGGQRGENKKSRPKWEESNRRCRMSNRKRPLLHRCMKHQQLMNDAGKMRSKLTGCTGKGKEKSRPLDDLEGKGGKRNLCPAPVCLVEGIKRLESATSVTHARTPRELAEPKKLSSGCDTRGKTNTSGVATTDRVFWEDYYC